MCVALDALKRLEDGPARSISGDCFALSVRPAKQLPFSTRVLIHDPVDEPVDRGATHLRHVERPQLTPFITSLPQPVDEPLEKVKLRASVGRQSGPLPDDLLSKVSLDLRATR